MNLFTALVAITAILAVVTISRHWFESRRKSGLNHERLEQLDSELRERIETLERIVTDQRDALRKKFDEI